MSEPLSAARPAPRAPRLVAAIARSWDEVEESQALRHRIFAGEMGARLYGPRPGLDSDRFDAYCDHLLVREAETGALVASTRLLSDVAAIQAGSFYSATEFELGGVLAAPGRLLEVGRTCVAAGWRNGATIGVLWAGLARHVSAHGFDALIGCASIPLADGGRNARAIRHVVEREHLAPVSLRARPRLALPDGPVATGEPSFPPLLKAYLRLGAWVCGELSWDPEFNVADALIFLDVHRLNARHHRHFVARTGDPAGALLGGVGQPSQPAAP